MNSSRPALAVGPMSPEIIEAVFRFSHYHRKQLMLIASKNQIDWNGGYVNDWTTERYMAFVNDQKKQYPDSTVLVCRDHCGPGFNGNDSIDDVYKTIESDLKCGFDLIHIDFCHYKGTYEERLKESKRAVVFCLKTRPDILLEIGTDENTGTNYTIANKEEIEREIDFFMMFCKPKFFVVQTGSLVMEINQVGSFNKDFVEKIVPLVRGRGIQLKEHNADYLSKEEIELRLGIVDAMNIAPQLGVVQTQTMLTKCLMFGVKFDDFINEAYKGGKWKKWLNTHTAENKMLCAMIAGHYHFKGDAYKKIMGALEAREDIHETIITAITDIINHYVND